MVQSNHFFQNISRVSSSERCAGIFKVSNAWENVRNKNMKEKSGVKKQNSNKRGRGGILKGYEQNDHACSVGACLQRGGSFRTLGLWDAESRIPLPVRTFCWPTRLGQIKARLAITVPNGQAKTPDTPLRLTGISGMAKVTHIFTAFLVILEIMWPVFSSRISCSHTIGWVAGSCRRD